MAIPEFIKNLQQQTDKFVLEVAILVWNNRRHFVEWPERGDVLFAPGICRPGIRFHRYNDKQKALLLENGIRSDTRSNGPAIMSYRLAGGRRPQREKPGREWSIHHIYDGNFPAPGCATTTRAVAHSEYFTRAAGLVAVHPIADGLADECAYFAWLLRYEAFIRFKFDPDRVFSTPIGDLTNRSPSPTSS